jgi:hypothetical protein
MLLLAVLIVDIYITIVDFAGHGFGGCVVVVGC